MTKTTTELIELLRRCDEQTRNGDVLTVAQGLDCIRNALPAIVADLEALQETVATLTKQLQEEREARGFDMRQP